MKQNELSDWIDKLEGQKKLTHMQVIDLQWHIKRLDGCDDLEKEIAIDCIVHEIRQKIAPKVDEFKTMFEKSHKKRR